MALHICTLFDANLFFYHNVANVCSHYCHITYSVVAMSNVSNCAKSALAHADMSNWSACHCYSATAVQQTNRKYK